MTKILVPIDFSLESKWGFQYAYNLASTMHAELIVLHLYQPDNRIIYSAGQLIETRYRQEKLLLEKLKREIKELLSQKFNLMKISYKINEGRKTRITDFANIYGANLIVMGNLKKEFLFDEIWGSVSSLVLKKATCPVLVVPSACSDLLVPKPIFYQ